MEDLPAVGPPLVTLQTKLTGGDWLVAWLLEPSRLRPGTSMPDFELTAHEAQAMAACLFDAAPARQGLATGVGPRSWQGGNARTGEQLFVARGCRGCHAIAPGEASVAPRVPNLAGIGLEVRGDWLFAWIKSPRAYHPRTAMPRLVLSDDEVRHLVAFLLTRRDGADVVASAPRFDLHADAAAGRALLERYECGKCHEMRGSPPPPAPFALASVDTPESALRDGRRLVAYYNCRGCHPIEGSGGAIREHLERKTLAPPTLESEGARVQTSWLIDFLERPQTLRPWLQIRMPDYGFSRPQATALARYFAALAGVQATDEPAATASADALAHGLRRFAHFKCVQCHPTTAGQLPAGVDPEDLSINLTLAKTRLRPSWIRDFLARPKAIVGTQTRMPAIFYSSDGIPKVDDPGRDIEAVSTYLLHMSEPPEAALAKLESERKNGAQKQPTDWTTYEY